MDNKKMNGPRYLALALLAMRNGLKDECVQYMSKAAEFGDDLTQFVDQIQRIGNTATRTSPSTSETENTMSPSLQIATASSQQRFMAAAASISRNIAVSKFIDDGDELLEDISDEELEASYALEFDDEGFDDDDEDLGNESVGPVRLV